AVAGFSSTLSLTILTLPASELAISSSAGAIILQGPHHSAQKSTTTGSEDFSTSVSKFASDTLATPMGDLVSYESGWGAGPEQGPERMNAPPERQGASRGVDMRQRLIQHGRWDFHQLGCIGPDQRRANRAVRIESGKDVAVQRELPDVIPWHVIEPARGRAVGLVIGDQNGPGRFDQTVDLA